MSTRENELPLPRLDIEFHAHEPEVDRVVFHDDEVEDVRREATATIERYRAIVREATGAKERLTQAGFSMQAELNWLSAVTVGFLKDAVADIVGSAVDFPNAKPPVPPGTNFYVIGAGSVGRYEIIGASDLDVMVIAIGPATDNQAATRYGNWLRYAGGELFTRLRAGQLTIGALNFDPDPGVHSHPTNAALFNAWDGAAENVKIQRYAQLSDSVLLHQEGPNPDFRNLRNDFFTHMTLQRWQAFFRYSWTSFGRVSNAFERTDALMIKTRFLRPIQMLLLPLYFQQEHAGEDLRTTNIQRLWRLVELGIFGADAARKAEDVYFKALRWELNANIKLSGGSMKLHHAQAASDNFKRKFTADIRATLITVREIVAEFQRSYNALNDDARVV